MAHEAEEPGADRANNPLVKKLPQRVYGLYLIVVGKGVGMVVVVMGDGQLL